MHPDWIVKSCERGELLPWHQFALYRGPLPSQRPLAFPVPPPAELAVSAVPAPQPELAVGPLPLEPTAAPEAETAVDLPDDDNDLDEEEGVAPMQEDAAEDDGDDHGGWTSAMMGRSMVEREAAAFRSDWVQQNISTHPDFLARYFASSRLHFLSTWKNEFTKLVGDIMTCVKPRGRSQSSPPHRTLTPPRPTPPNSYPVPAHPTELLPRPGPPHRILAPPRPIPPMHPPWPSLLSSRLSVPVSRAPACSKRSLATTTTAATAAAPTKRRVIFHVDMDCFFVSVGIRDRPHLRDMPVGVSHSKGAMEAASAEIGRWPTDESALSGAPVADPVVVRGVKQRPATISHANLESPTA